MEECEQGTWGGAIQEECMHSRVAKADTGVLCLREVGLRLTGRKNWRLSPLLPSALVLHVCPFCDGSQTPRPGVPQGRTRKG